VQAPAHLAIAWPAYSVGQGHGRTETALRIRTPSADASCWSNCGQTTESRPTGLSRRQRRVVSSRTYVAVLARRQPRVITYSSSSFFLLTFASSFVITIYNSTSPANSKRIRQRSNGEDWDVRGGLSRIPVAVIYKRFLVVPSHGSPVRLSPLRNAGQKP
jgi:hypothetical protein